MAKKKKGAQDETGGAAAHDAPKAAQDATAPAQAPEKKSAEAEKKAASPDPLAIALEESTKRAEELSKQIKYLQAEFDNYKKWAEKDKAEFTKVANERLVKNLLPVIDTFDKALENVEGDKSPLAEGVRLTYRELMGALAQSGLRPINAAGKKFDPYFHEALIAEACEGAQDGQILQELQRGYLLNDRVIRTAKVKIAKKPDPEPPQEPTASAEKAPAPQETAKPEEKGGAGQG